MLEVVACNYSFSDCQILVGQADDEGNLLISQGKLYKNIAISECAKQVIKLSDYRRNIWINRHMPLKKALSLRGVSGEVDFSQQDVELKDLFKSLKHTKKIKMSENLEATGNQFALALQILIKALMNPLSGRCGGGIPENCCGVYDVENGEIDPIAELRNVLKLFDV